MSTENKRTFFNDKRNLPQQRIKDTFFDYIIDRVSEISQRVWSSERGIFGTCTLTSAGDDKFNIATPKDMLDGDGNILNFSTSDPNGSNIEFENELGIVYYIGARHVLIPSGVLRNSRIGTVIFYDTDEDQIGEIAEPDYVIEIAGQLKIKVDSVFETGVDHSGRLVTVFLRKPLTINESIAIERDVVVQWVAGENVIYTTGLLGQGTGASSSLIADYQVVAQGVTVRRNTDLSITSPYAYIGTVTGGGAGSPPSSFSTIGQIDVTNGINPDLQEAYTSGRIITPSSTYGGAVKIQSADSGDEYKSVLTLNRKGATEFSPIALNVITNPDNGIAQMNLIPLADGTDLQSDEVCDSQVTNGQIILTRALVDMITVGVNSDCDFVYNYGFITDAMNGIFKIDSIVSLNTLNLENLDGSVIGTWNSGETGNCTILRPRFIVSEENSSDIDGVSNGVVINAFKNNDALKIFPRNGDTSLKIYDNAATTRYIIQADTDKLKLGQSPSASVIVPCGLDFTGHANGVGNADKHAFNIKAYNNPALVSKAKTSSRVMSLIDDDGYEMMRFMNGGRIANGAIFEDDFMYVAEPSHKYGIINTGTSSIAWNENLIYSANRNGGYAILRPEGSTNDYSIIQSGNHFTSDDGTVINRRAFLFIVRVCIRDTSLQNLYTRIFLEFDANVNSPAEIGIYYRRFTAGVDSWYGYASHNGDPITGGTVNAIQLGSDLTVGGQQDDDIEWYTFMIKFDINSDMCKFSHNGSYWQSISIPNQSDSDWLNYFKIKARAETLSGVGNVKEVYLDYWKLQELQIKGDSNSEVPKE